MTMINPAHPTTAAERYASALPNNLLAALDTLGSGATATLTNSANGTSVNGPPAVQRAFTQKQPTDTITFSPLAMASLQNAQIALAVISGKKGAPAIQAVGANTSPVPVETTVTQASTTGADTPSSAIEAFKTQYAQEAADGPAGRFYNSTTPEDLGSIMSDDEYASFKAAFDSQTLTIQSATDASGVTMTGSFNTTFAAGVGMSVGGSGNVDTTQLLKTSKYALVQLDPFFGPTVISWGGPPDATPNAS